MLDRLLHAAPPAPPAPPPPPAGGPARLLLAVAALPASDAGLLRAKAALLAALRAPRP